MALSNVRVPFFAFEFDASQASQGPAILAYEALIIGQRTASGTAAADTFQRVTSADEVATLAGRGSMLHRSAIGWFASNQSTSVWIGVLDDDGAGVAATGSIAVTGPATAAGTLALYAGGERIAIGVDSGDTATDIAAAIVAALPAVSDYPITGAVDGGDPTIANVTYRHKGEVGNSYDIRVNYAEGEVLPAGVGVTITPLSGGTSNPSLAGLITAIGDKWFHVVTHPYTDATSLTTIETELASRADPLRGIDGVAFTSAAGSFATLTALGSSRNSQYSTICAQPGESPLTPVNEFAAEVAGVVAKYGAADPARPFQTLTLSHTKPTPETDRFTVFPELNLLLFEGIAVTQVVAGGRVALGRMITTYQKNAAGADDTAYLDVNTVLTLMYLRYSFRQRLQTKYPRHKLANDGTRFRAGQAVMTPSLGKGEALTWFREQEELALVEGYDQFKTGLVVARSTTDPNSLEFLLPPDLINQFRLADGRIAFRN